MHRSSETDPAAMKEGEAYAKLENAFRHQREYVADWDLPWKSL